MQISEAIIDGEWECAEEGTIMVMEDRNAWEGTWKWNDESGESERGFVESNMQDEGEFESLTSEMAHF